MPKAEIPRANETLESHNSLTCIIRFSLFPSDVTYPWVLYCTQCGVVMKIFLWGNFKPHKLI